MNLMCLCITLTQTKKLNILPNFLQLATYIILGSYVKNAFIVYSGMILNFNAL